MTPTLTHSTQELFGSLLLAQDGCFCSKMLHPQYQQNEKNRKPPIIQTFTLSTANFVVTQFNWPILAPFNFVIVIFVAVF